MNIDKQVQFSLNTRINLKLLFINELVILRADWNRKYSNI